MATITVTGNLGSDPKINTAQSGTSYSRFSLAWAESQKDKSGQWQQGPTVWIHVTCFGKVAESVARNIRKGHRVTVSGTITPEEWTDRQGQISTELTIRANSVAVDLTFQDVNISKHQTQQGYGMGGFGDTGQAPF
ncbi:single-stranded DNA-binding protein [Corynebacterium pyruviciproducens ATCC BAA-1742]|uniref:Single-stranded DNA-binding protein n=1 Tax=Corynebacterium pyruviciproducens ATCC BAA-1742 TaxID=1125779 RepID=S3A3R1_9CORY|nr:single-stranded DNA-binding protein [Corynebacterium pyruviciproducens]EPD70849.1 single-stranded DNA-binding protein [Corynebacterium pyruviciproducens ATCC BAA-1742]